VSGTDPEETMPFTHRPYGEDEAVDPATSPEGSANQASGPGFVPPSVAPPPTTGSPVPAPAWGAAYPAVYGAPLVGAQTHRGASNARTLGIVALVSAGVALFCCVTLPGVFCAPFAWAIGARARREIDANPGVYRNRGEAQAGVVMGIIGTVLGVLVLLVVVGFAILIGSGWSLV